MKLRLAIFIIWKIIISVVSAMSVAAIGRRCYGIVMSLERIRAVASRTHESGVEGWQLTTAGLGQVRASCDLDLGVRALQPRAIPLEDLPPYEMLVNLKRARVGVEAHSK